MKKTDSEFLKNELNENESNKNSFVAACAWFSS